MGNTILGISLITSPIITNELVLPFIFHPYRWGGIPWTPPSTFMQSLVRFISNTLLFFVFAIANYMASTVKRCDKYDFWQSFKRTLWPFLAFLLANAFFSFATVIKAPIISATNTWLPYAGHIVQGTLVATMVMLFSAIGRDMLLKEVC
jgi:hypothetical protein